MVRSALMRGRVPHSRGLALGLALLGLIAATPVALATPTYAALDEAPAEGGELRVATPGQYTDDEGRTLIAFPLTHTRVDAEVQGPMIQVQVEQTFENPFPDPIEAVYVFPMSPDAAVNAYEIVIGERTIIGHIAEADVAEQIYEDAKAAGHTTGLLKQTKPNVFVQSIANIAPGETIVVRFRYVELLQYEHGRGFRFVYPMTLTPRFLPEGTTDPHPVSGGGGARADTHVEYVGPGESGTVVELHVGLDAGVPVHNLSSPSHAITHTLMDTWGEVTLADGAAIPNSDFILDIDSAGEQTVVGVLAHRDEEHGGFFTLVVQPKLEYVEGDITPREVTLLIDVSGSMGGEPLARAKFFAEELLASVSERDTLNIITFASSTEQLSPSPVAGTAANVQLGLDFVSGLTAGGGTYMNSGIQAALGHAPAGETIRMVYLLTDGGVGNDDEILAAVRTPEGENRIFPVGISAAPNRYLLDRLADEGRGFASYVNLIEDPTLVATALVRRTLWPYLTDISIDWGGLPIDQVTPEVLPDVYAGLPLVVAGRYEYGGSGRIVVNGRRAGQPFSLPLQLELPDYEPREPVAYLWAGRRIRELLAKQYGGEVPEIVAEVTKLGLEFSLVTPYTSFVAVDDGRVVDGELQTVTQPSETPSGYGGSSAGSSDSGSGYAGYGSAWGGDDKAGDMDILTLLVLGGLLALALRRRRRGEVDAA